MKRLFMELVRCLREIDREAVPRADGLPTGLRWYAGHVEPSLSVRATERSENLWSQRIRELLRAHEIGCGYQAYYPNSRQTCDLVVDWPKGQPVWIEVKRSYRECVYPEGVRANGAYSKYLWQTAEDLRKLDQLKSSSAKHVALLLIGFDRPERAISESDLVPITDVAAAAAWQCEQTSWDDQWYRGFRVRCWLWWKAAGEAAPRVASAAPLEGGAHADPDVHARTIQALQKRLKSQLEGHGGLWWETAIAEICDVAEDSKLVEVVGAQLRQNEERALGKFKVLDYLTTCGQPTSDFQRVVATVEELVCAAHRDGLSTASGTGRLQRSFKGMQPR